MNNRMSKEKELDPSDPNDNAFALVTQFNVPPARALELSQATCERTGFYARIRRWRARQACEVESATTPPSDVSSLTAPSVTSSSTSSNMADSARTSTRSDRRIRYLKANMTSWTDFEKTNQAMSKRKKRSSTEVVQDAFIEKADKEYYCKRYKEAYKAATKEIDTNKSDPDKQAKRGFGIRAIVQRVNKEMLPSPNDKKLTRGAVYNAIARGDIGISPPKIGRNEIIPRLVTKALATQATMMQVCAEGEASAPIMKATASALIAGTGHKFSVEYAWRKTRTQHPEMLNPVKAKNHEDRRVDWLTYKNIMDWNKRAKKFLIDIGMAKDTPGLIHGVMSEVSLVHPDDVDWFLTLDETHHELSTVGNRGGSTTTRYANPSFPRSGDRVVQTGGHISGVYAFTLRGESLPPLYIFSTVAEVEENMKYRPDICEGLPTVEARYAQESIFNHPSRTVLRQKGSMDTSLWHDLHRSVYLTCGYRGKLSPQPVRDPITQKLISGPLIIKTDAGPGRLSSEASSIEFREEMANLGVFILLSLPNGTECQAELDQMYSEFKPRCRKSTVRVAGIKMAARVEARKRQIDNIDSSDGSDSDDSDGDEKQSSKKRRSICNVSLNARDLAHVVNGYPGDPVELRPFDYCFTKEKIIKSWINVGFMPMTGNAASDSKVRHELGEGGAPAESTNRIEKLVEEYSKIGDELTQLGYNGGVLDLEPPVARNETLQADEDAQVEEIVKKRTINKAGGLFRAGVQIANSRVVLRAAKIIADEDELNKAKAAQKKKEREEAMQADAMTAFGRWVASGRKVNVNGWPELNKKDALAIIRVLLPRLDIKKELKMGNFKTVKDCNKWLGEIRMGTTWDAEMEALTMEQECSDVPPPPETTVD